MGTPYKTKNLRWHDEDYREIMVLNIDERVEYEQIDTWDYGWPWTSGRRQSMSRRLFNENYEEIDLSDL